MISFSGSLKIFLFVDCCDMRKGFNGCHLQLIVDWRILERFLHLNSRADSRFCS